MQGNPYSRILKQMQKHGAINNPPCIEIGEVTSTNPLTIQIGELQLDKDNLLIADYLLENYTRKMQIPSTNDVSGQTNIINDGGMNASAHNHTIDNIAITGEMILKDTLKKGDKLAVIATADEQTYVILARVVSL